jgi:hypothetical protein
MRVFDEVVELLMTLASYNNRTLILDHAATPLMHAKGRQYTFFNFLLSLSYM